MMGPRSSKDAGVMESGSEPSLLKRPKITHESQQDLQGGERQSAPTPPTEVVDVDMDEFEDPSVPYGGIPEGKDSRNILRARGGAKVQLCKGSTMIELLLPGPS